MNPADVALVLLVLAGGSVAAWWLWQALDSRQGTWRRQLPTRCWYGHLEGCRDQHRPLPCRTCGAGGVR